jgi:hypothetical protein
VPCGETLTEDVPKGERRRDEVRDRKNQTVLPEAGFTSPSGSGSRDERRANPAARWRRPSPAAVGAAMKTSKTFPIIAHSSKALDKRLKAKWAKDLPRDF